MGTVYEGENVRIERKVAIKVLHAHVASSPEFASRFEREARASARIGSLHVCDVLDLGDLPSGDRFIVMEYLDGESLEDRIAAGKMDAAKLAPIAFEVLDGLGAMHQASVIHRDLKPANVFLARRPGKRETVKILDFGVAKIVPRADEPGEMTSTGMMMGTPLYMSPEQARGARDVDGRTDLYAASVMFYRALTGQLPHVGDNLHELLFKIVLEEPVPILTLAPEVDPDFAAIVTKGLARDADQRWPSARAFQEAIVAWGDAQGIASLRFTITLPDEQPPLRSITGGFPSERIRASSGSSTGPQEPIGTGTTPAFAKTLPVAETPLPMKVPAAPTPTAWAEDAPEIAKRALAESKRTLESETRPPPPAIITTPPQARRRNALLAVLGVAVIGGVALGVRAASRPSVPSAATSAPASTSATSLAVTAPSVTETAEPPAATEKASPTAEPVTSAVAETTTAAKPRSIVAAPRPTAVVASVSASASAAPPKPSATATGRRFRTTIE